jgi:Lanthionine synthetase C-like protein
VSGGAAYRDLGEAAWAWVLRQVREDDGPWLPEAVDPEAPAPGPDRDTLYSGVAGLAPVLAEIGLDRPLDAAEQALAAGVVDRLAATAAGRAEPCLYDGLGGDVTALRLLAPGRHVPALHRLSELATATGWPTTVELEPRSDLPFNDVVLGTAGVVLAAAWAGGDGAQAVVTRGAEALLRTADRTDAGLDWAMQPGWRSRMPNYSHGTAGVAAALAVAGAALDRADWIDAAVLGARHVLAVGSLGDDGFRVPITIPHTRADVEPFAYGWCHGPTGTSYLFAALAHAGVRQVGGHDVAELRRQCLHAVLTSGVPERLRPGFWDNDGRCCGTAGVGEALLDAGQGAGQGAGQWGEASRRLLAAARVMGDAVAARAVRDEAGARWRFVEHRQDPPLLPPSTGWMQGAAGIAAFLLRLARVLDDGPGARVIDRPDQWWAVPARLRSVATGA